MNVLPKNQRPNQRQNQRHGMVLIVVLVLVLLMGVAAYGFLLSMQTENIAARAGGDRLTNQQAAFSGIEWLSAVLEKPRSERRGLLADFIDSDRSGGIPLDDSAIGNEDAPRFFVPMPQRPIVDESVKLHLSSLVEWDKQQQGSGRLALMRLPGMTDDVADAILDWLDADTDQRPEGAEADVYADAEAGYQPRNGVPPDLEELLLVRGVDKRLLFGTVPPGTAPEPTTSKPTAQENLSSSEETFRPWSEYLTVTSGERNESRDGAPRVFLNEPQLDLLHQQLVERMPLAWANFIVLYRQHSPGGSSGRTSPQQITLDFTMPAIRLIESPLDLVDASLAVLRNEKTVNVASPFSSEPLMMQDQLPKLLDQVTVDFEKNIIGRINVNSANREVLLAVPGIDEALAERILGARSLGDETTPGREHPVWLLAEGLLDIAVMKTLLPHLNTGGDVFRAEFLGRSARRVPPYRCEVVIDATNENARQVYFREVTGKDSLPIPNHDRVK